MKKLFYILSCALVVLCTACVKSHEYVDLGLPSGIKWATCNVGANAPEEYGDYFAWGETEPKSDYNWSTCKWCKRSYILETKYYTDSEYGSVDNKPLLILSNDAANANWGGSWRMPTKAEQDELRNECTWDWTTKNGVNGYTVIGPNGNSIFLPAAGCRGKSDLDNAGSDGYYWSSSLDSHDSDFACVLRFDSKGLRGSWSSSVCFYGLSVRPVLP